MEEFKVAKVRLMMTLRDSEDSIITDVVPDVRTGRKWDARQEVDQMESRLKHKDIVGYTQSGRAGFGNQEFKYYYKATDKERRVLVVEHKGVILHNEHSSYFFATMELLWLLCMIMHSSCLVAT